MKVYAINIYYVIHYIAKYDIKNVLSFCISIQPLKNILDKKNSNFVRNAIRTPFVQLVYLSCTIDVIKKNPNLVRNASLYIIYTISIFVLHSEYNRFV